MHSGSLSANPGMHTNPEVAGSSPVGGANGADAPELSVTRYATETPRMSATVGKSSKGQARPPRHRRDIVPCWTPSALAISLWTTPRRADSARIFDATISTKFVVFMPKVYTKTAYSTTVFHRFMHDWLDMEYVAVAYLIHAINTNHRHAAC